MARISTYTNASPVTLSDKFIGTEVAGTPVNVTKNFLISDLLALFQSNITLQNVLDAGNTATQSIILTGDITQTGNFSITGGALSLGGTVRGKWSACFWFGTYESESSAGIKHWQHCNSRYQPNG